MLIRVLLLISMTMLASCAGVPLAEVTPNPETPFEFAARSGTTVAAYRGSFSVPENRSDPSSRQLTLRYVRFPATGDNPGAPIVYLAGGPGGSGIWFAGQWRFPLFMALREFGDVIALDQRGTGDSDDTPPCISAQIFDDERVLSDVQYVSMHNKALGECLNFWAARGVDVRGYNTRESVADLEALRRQLGADALSLWGLSYGAHLALAAVNEFPQRIDRVVLASVEGLTQTVKLPTRTDAYIQRLQQALLSTGERSQKPLALDELIRRVHRALEKEPLSLAIAADADANTNLLFQRRHMQQLAAAMVADPNRFATALVRIYLALDRGDHEPLLRMLVRWHEPNASITYRVMPTMMDIASGVGRQRLLQISEQSEASLLGPLFNGPLYLTERAAEFDLGEDFRREPVADVPILVLSGTLDGRTYIESQREAVAGMSARQLVTVRNAGHNLFMASPEVTATIQEFMRGVNVDGREIVIDPPSL